MLRVRSAPCTRRDLSGNVTEFATANGRVTKTAATMTKYPDLMMADFSEMIGTEQRDLYYTVIHAELQSLMPKDTIVYVLWAQL